MAQRKRKARNVGDQGPPQLPLVQRYSEHIFLKKPRFLGFAHRGTASLRHPYLPYMVDLAAGLSAPKRTEKLLDALMASEEVQARWREVGKLWGQRMIDSDINERRDAVLRSIDVQGALERWWTEAGGTIGHGITEERYRQLNRVLYTILLKEADVSIVSAANSAIAEDWVYDTRGNPELDFAAFSLSILELADNWHGASLLPSAEAFARYLDYLRTEALEQR